MWPANPVKEMLMTNQFRCFKFESNISGLKFILGGSSETIQFLSIKTWFLKADQCSSHLLFRGSGMRWRKVGMLQGQSPLPVVIIDNQCLCPFIKRRWTPRPFYLSNSENVMYNLTTYSWCNMMRWNMVFIEAHGMIGLLFQRGRWVDGLLTLEYPFMLWYLLKCPPAPWANRTEVQSPFVWWYLVWIMS